MSSSNSAKAPTQGASSYRMYVTAGQTGSDTTARSERVALVEAIVSEGDQLARDTQGPEIIYSMSVLAQASRRQLLAIAKRCGFDGSCFDDLALMNHISVVQMQRTEIAQLVRHQRVEQAQERIALLIDRLRDILPEGVRLGDYLQDKSYGEKQRLRPARRIY